MEEELSRKDSEKDAVKEELETLKKEQEDLLVLLADQDTKIDKYKKKLKELGQEVCTKGEVNSIYIVKSMKSLDGLCNINFYLLSQV